MKIVIELKGRFTMIYLPVLGDIRSSRVFWGHWRAARVQLGSVFLKFPKETSEESVLTLQVPNYSRWAIYFFLGQYFLTYFIFTALDSFSKMAWTLEPITTKSQRELAETLLSPSPGKSQGSLPLSSQLPSNSHDVFIICFPAVPKVTCVTGNGLAVRVW